MNAFQQILLSMALWMSFFGFIYKSYYGEYYKSIKFNMNQSSPASSIYQSTAVILCFPVYLMNVDDHGFINYFYCTFFTSMVISYLLIDLTYYQHGKTLIAWLIHHIILIFGLIGNYVIDVFYIQMKMMFLYELGSLIFCQTWRRETIKNNKLLRFICIMGYIITRIICTFKLCVV